MYQWIKAWRMEAGMTQQELAEKVFITPQAISLMEKGKRSVSLEQLEDIATACGKKMTLFFGDQLCVEEIEEEDLSTNIDRYFVDMWEAPGLINLDKEDIDTYIASVKGKAVLGRLSGMENSRVISSLFYEINKIRPLHEAKAVLLNIVGSTSFAFDHLDEVSQRLHEEVNEACNLIIGSSINDDVDEGFVLRILAVGYDEDENALQMINKQVG